MVSQHVVNIILQAEDRISTVTKKVEESINKIGPTGRNSFQTVSQASDQFQKTVEKQAPTLDQVQQKIQQMGARGISAFNSLSAEERKILSQTAQMQTALSSASSRIQSLGYTGVSAFNQMTAAERQALVTMSSMTQTTSSVGAAVGGLGTRIRTSIGAAWDSVKTKASTTADSVKTKFSSAIDSAKSKVQSLADSFSGVGGVISSVIGGLGVASFSQLTIGLAMTREQMTNLTQATMGSRAEADAFVGSMDKLTNDSLVSLNDLGQAMNTIKMSTGMSNSELQSFSTTVNDIGQRAILMGKDSNEAMTIMQAAGRGLNGEFEILKTNFGITKEQLVDAGWSGAADDVAGYQEALEKCLEAGGSMDGMMDTTTGKIQQVKKGFTTAGRQIGEAFLPYIDQGLDFMIGLKDECPEAYTAIMGVGAGFSAFASVAPTLAPILSTFDSISSKISTVKDKLSGSWEDGKLNTLKGHFETLKTKITNVFPSLSDLRTRLGNIKAPTLSGISTSFGNVKTKILSAKTQLIQFMGKLKGIAVSNIANLATSFTNLASSLTIANIKTKLQAAYQWLVNGATAVWNTLLSMNPVMLVVMAIAALIAALLYLYNTNETVRNAINWLWEKLQELGSWIVDGFIAAWDSLVAALQPVINILSSILGPAIQGILALLSGDTNGALSLFTQSWNNLMSALGPVGEFLTAVFTPAWQLISQILQIIWSNVQQIIDIFNQFLNGQISLPEMLMMIWQTIQNMFVQILSLIINTVIQWASQLWNNALNAGRNFLNGIIQYVSQLPGRIWSFLLNVVSKIVSAGAQWVSNAKSKAQGVVTGVIDWIKQLPGKVYQEFMNIGKRILEAGSDLVNKAKQVGQDIVNGILGAMGIHSPGTIQESVVAEFVNMIERVRSTTSTAKRVVSDIGQSMVNAFKNKELENALNFDYLNEVTPGITQPVMETPAPVMGAVGADTSGLENGVSQTGMLSEEMQVGLDSMVMANQNAYSQMQMNEMNSMNMMSQHVLMSMNNILFSTRNAMTQANASTALNLQNMRNSTTNITNQMIQAWGTMKNSIIQAASDIRSKSKTHFDDLSKTIGSFYRKLQNPSGWGAGGRSSRGHASPKSRMSRVSNAIAQRANAPSTITINEVKRNPCIDSSCLSYLTPNGANVSTSDLIRGGCITCALGIDAIDNSGGAGWSSSVSPNVSHIKRTAGEWGMKGPVIFGKYPTGISFKVKEFENGTPNIDFQSFKGMAEDVFSQCNYLLYWDSERYGSWQAAFQNGNMNCSDSTDALIWMAHACGLDARKVHGYWGSMGHFWAEVEGHKMDTTGWMNQRNWTPSQSHAGGPARDPFQTQTDLLENIAYDLGTDRPFDIKTGEYVDDLVISGELKVVHEFKNLPEGVDESEVARIVKETTHDDSWIKTLVNNATFQKADSKAKTRIDRKVQRAKGV